MRSKIMSKRNYTTYNEDDSEEENETLLQQFAQEVVEANKDILVKLQDDESEDSNCDGMDCYQRFQLSTKKNNIQKYLRTRLIRRIEDSYMEYIGWSNDETLSQVDTEVDDMLKDDDSLETEDALKQVLQSKTVILDRAINEAIEGDDEDEDEDKEDDS
jgi:hypothetical protein